MASEYDIANKLIEDIYKFKREYAQDLTLMDTIIEYSIKNNHPIQDIGNILADHKEFTQMFENYLKKNNYIQGYKEEKTALEEDEWD
jgi:hypothetical protein